MTTERDDLAEGWYEFITDDGVTSVAYVFESGNLYLPVETLMDEDFMGAERIYRLVRAPRTVTTVEELDALPVGSVVLDGNGFTWDKWQDEEGDEFNYWATTLDRRPYQAKRIAFPATVLHEGDA